ncbi:MAG: Putative dioxygenase, partial [uncultured Sphingomonadaceae bacterium]
DSSAFSSRLPGPRSGCRAQLLWRPARLPRRAERRALDRLRFLRASDRRPPRSRHGAEAAPQSGRRSRCPRPALRRGAADGSMAIARRSAPARQCRLRDRAQHPLRRPVGRAGDDVLPRPLRQRARAQGNARSAQPFRDRL